MATKAPAERAAETAVHPTAILVELVEEAQEEAPPATEPLQLGEEAAANGRVRLRPAFRDQRFLGYYVYGRSGDPRYSHGDLITHVGGMPVEHSAAGSELVLIALQQPNITIDTTKR